MTLGRVLLGLLQVVDVTVLVMINDDDCDDDDDDDDVDYDDGDDGDNAIACFLPSLSLCAPPQCLVQTLPSFHRTSRVTHDTSHVTPHTSNVTLPLFQDSADVIAAMASM